MKKSFLLISFGELNTNNNNYAECFLSSLWPVPFHRGKVQDRQWIKIRSTKYNRFSKSGDPCTGSVLIGMVFYRGWFGQSLPVPRQRTEDLLRKEEMAEEVHAVLVADFGSSSVKLGYSGEDTPSYVFPSALPTGSGHSFGKGVESVEQSSQADIDAEYSSSGNSNAHSYTYPIQRGLVRDWDQLEKLWVKSMGAVGLKTIDDTSILLVESPRSTLSDKGKWAEMLFEKFRCPSICIGSSPAFCVYAAGRTSGLVVDCGAGVTTTVPVFEGLSLTHAAIVVEHAGQDVSQRLKKLFAEKNIHISMADAKLLKETYARCDLNFPNSKSEKDKETFYLPDCTEVTVENKIFNECTTQVFKRVFTCSADDMLSAPNPAATPPLGLASQVLESWSLCDEGVKKYLLQNVVVAGGGSFLEGLSDCLHRELAPQTAAYLEAKGQAAYEPRLLPSSVCKEPGYTNQRRFAQWVGASILSSLDNYRDLKVTRQEYEEGGFNILQARSLS